LWTWGDNFQGGLGTNDSSLVERSSPVQVGTDTNWSKIYGSGECFLAIKTDGTLYAWGANGNGTLGDNSIINRSSPVQVGALTVWNEVSAASSIIATQTNGTIWFWGFGFEGGSGTNTALTIYRSSPIQIGALTTWNKPATANDYSNGAIKNDGTLWLWGRNGNGQLAQNNTINRSSPVQVGSETNWTQATIGGDISSGIADGELYIWAANANGEGGQNNRIQYSSPVQVGTATDWVNSFQGSNDLYAITEGKTTT
jgi:alpha-tubulin suppressor-like RCC1 family protein